MNQTIRDLTQLASLDEVEAMTVGDGDHISELVPDWCELVLRLTREHSHQMLPLTRHDAELIIEVLWTVLHPNEHRRSPVERLWEQLDDVMDYLMVDDPEPEDKARAKALAEAIALISLPFADEPDVAAIRTQAVERWESRQ